MMAEDLQILLWQICSSIFTVQVAGSAPTYKNPFNEQFSNSNKRYAIKLTLCLPSEALSGQS